MSSFVRNSTTAMICFSLPVYVSFLWASHLFEERLGSERAKGSQVFSAVAPSMSPNPVLGGMKDMLLWRPWLTFSLNKCSESCLTGALMVVNEQTKSRLNNSLCCAENRKCWSCHIVKELLLRRWSNICRAFLALTMQHLVELIRAGDSKDSNFCVATNTKGTSCFVWGLKSSGTRTALEGVVQGSCLTHTKAAGSWWLQSSMVLLLNVNAAVYSSIATYHIKYTRTIARLQIHPNYAADPVITHTFSYTFCIELKQF